MQSGFEFNTQNLCKRFIGFSDIEGKYNGVLCEKGPCNVINFEFFEFGNAVESMDPKSTHWYMLDITMPNDANVLVSLDGNRVTTDQVIVKKINHYETFLKYRPDILKKKSRYLCWTERSIIRHIITREVDNFSPRFLTVDPIYHIKLMCEIATYRYPPSLEYVRKDLQTAKMCANAIKEYEDQKLSDHSIDDVRQFVRGDLVKDVNMYLKLWDDFKGKHVASQKDSEKDDDIVLLSPKNIGSK